MRLELDIVVGLQHCPVVDPVRAFFLFSGVFLRGGSHTLFLRRFPFCAISWIIACAAFFFFWYQSGCMPKSRVSVSLSGSQDAHHRCANLRYSVLCLLASLISLGTCWTGSFGQCKLLQQNEVVDVDQRIRERERNASIASTL